MRLPAGLKCFQLCAHDVHQLYGEGIYIFGTTALSKFGSGWVLDLVRLHQLNMIFTKNSSLNNNMVQTKSNSIIINL